MDDFLLVAGLDWIEIASPSVAFLGFADIPTIVDLVTNEDWSSLSGVMESAELIPNGAIILEARIVNTGTALETYRFWYRI